MAPRVKKSKETGKETTKLVLPNFNTFNIFLCAFNSDGDFAHQEDAKESHCYALAVTQDTQKATSEGRFLMETGTL